MHHSSPSIKEKYLHPGSSSNLERFHSSRISFSLLHQTRNYSDKVNKKFFKMDSSIKNLPKLLLSSELDKITSHIIHVSQMVNTSANMISVSTCYDMNHWVCLFIIWSSRKTNTKMLPSIILSYITWEESMEIFLWRIVGNE